MLLTGEFGDATKLFAGSSEAFVDQIKLTGTNILGLTFIFVGLSLLGPIKLAFITSSRKVFSMLISIFVFNKSLNYLQIIGMMFVFFGMISETIKGKESKKHHKEHKEVHEEGSKAGESTKEKGE